MFHHGGFRHGAGDQQNGDGRARAARVPLAPKIAATTVPGSLYSSMLVAIARLGMLAEHDRLFAVFKRERSAAAARKLIQAIGVSRSEMEAMVRADAQFREHCVMRTQALRRRAARGDARAQGILKNRTICDARGRWKGDIDEAVAILTGARTPEQEGEHKNVRIIRRIRLLFRSSLNGTEQVLFLYRDKHHRLVERALALSAPPASTRA